MDAQIFQECARGELDCSLDPGRLRELRDDKGNSLLHACNDEKTLSFLLAQGLDPNARNLAGLTPLMRYRKAECNRLLCEAGGDVNAEDHKGNTALAYQAGSLDGCIGYCAPDFAALEVLVAAGARPPEPELAESWIEWARGQVSAAVEYNDFKHFEKWVLGLTR